jgi:protein SCO1
MCRAPGLYLAVLLSIILAGAVYVLHQRHLPPAAESVNAIRQDIGGHFALVDSGGRPVSDLDFRGKWLLIYFGYTRCPGACPTTLATMADTLTRLGALGDKVRLLFVTVDPERDTPQALAAYTKAIDAKIEGLTGTPEQISAAAKAYHVDYAKRQVGDDYYMDHSTIIHVVKPDGSYAKFFFDTASALEMAQSLREMMRQEPASS